MADAPATAVTQAPAPRVVVDTASALTEAVARLAGGEGPVAVDTERASGFRYSPRAWLIQLFRRGSGVVLLDPPALADAGGDGLASVQAAIGDEEWILHAASQDLPSLRDAGLEPSLVFDTELAARLAGLPRVGLASVVESLLGVHLAKEHSAADWSTRPLPASWLEYAAQDVELLVDVRDALAALLAEQGKSGIADQEFRAVVAARPKPPRPDPWRRLSGLSGIRSARSLAVARELWHARDGLARQTDTAPGRLVPDAALTAVARALPSSRGELAGLREFTGRASRSRLDLWWSAVEAGLATDDVPPLRVRGEGPPQPRVWSDRDPDADARLKAARPAIAEVAERLGMPTENLLTPDHLRRVAWSPPEPADAAAVGAALAALGARPWQVETTAGVIARAFVDARQAPDGVVAAE